MSDKNLYSYYETSSGKLINDYRDLGTPTSNPDWSDTLKYTSGIENFTHIVHGRVYGGREDCADINNRASDIYLWADGWIPQGRYAFTIKGGARNVVLRGRLVRHGTSADVELGAHSDQSNEEVSGVHICLTGAPVFVRVLNADKPTAGPDTDIRYLFPHPDAWYHGIVVKIWLLVSRLFR